jgi:molecular chaperone GrpE
MTDEPQNERTPEPEVLDGSAEEIPEGAGPGAPGGPGADDSPPTPEREAEPEPEPEPESELDAALREREEYLDLAQRARADLDNYRKRTSAETGAAERRGRAALAGDLIPALDNLERALLAAGVEPEGTTPPEGEPASQEVSAHLALAEGVALVYRELREGLQRAGVERFDPSGERFDPATCEAVATAGGDGAEKGTVIEVLEKGYRIGDLLLRPARVVVSE